MHSRQYNNATTAPSAVNNKMEQVKHLNPFAADQEANNNNSQMTHLENGFRAASHVSMEHTIHAHEYQPSCSCDDCQTLLNHYTNYEILDAFVSHHLKYEAQVQSSFGFVPCVGGPHGNVAMKIVPSENNADELEQVPQVSNTYLFHMHLHHMKAVPADVRERSYQKFFNTNNNNNNNAVAEKISVPTPRHMMNNRNNNSNNNNMTKAFATHQNVHYKNNNNNNYNNKRNYNNNNNVAAAAPSYNSNNYNNYYAHEQQQQTTTAAAAPSYNNSYSNNNYNYNYSTTEVEQAQQSVAFSGVARLGM